MAVRKEEAGRKKLEVEQLGSLSDIFFHNATTTDGKVQSIANAEAQKTEQPIKAA